MGDFERKWSDDQRDWVINQALHHGRTLKDAAASMDMPYETAKKYLQAAKKDITRKALAGTAIDVELELQVKRVLRLSDTELERIEEAGKTGDIALDRMEKLTRVLVSADRLAKANKPVKGEASAKEPEDPALASMMKAAQKRAESGKGQAGAQAA
jgi:predicted DNA-binding protein (UPF0251 family)